MKNESKEIHRLKGGTTRGLWKRIWYHRYLYCFFIPALILYILFSYIPMYGITLAFKDLDYKAGIWGSPWTSMNGLKHFYELMSNNDFWRALRNTLVISFGRILIEFPIPIVLALLINEIRIRKFRRTVQTILTFPHFISWVVLSGILLTIFSNAGVVNAIIQMLGLEKVNFLTNPDTFRWFLFATNIWKEAGWSTIIYLAALASVNSELYEAAMVDGANRFQLSWHVSLPTIVSVIGVMLILAVSNIMNAGFDQIFNLMNGVVKDQVNILDTYIYERSLATGMNFASSTAIGLFKSVVSVLLLTISNFFVKRTTGEGIY